MILTAFILLVLVGSTLAAQPTDDLKTKTVTVLLTSDSNALNLPPNPIADPEYIYVCQKVKRIQSPAAWPAASSAAEPPAEQLPSPAKFVADQFGQSLNSVRDAETNPASSFDARDESALNKPAADERPAESIGEQPVNEPEPAIKSAMDISKSSENMTDPIGQSAVANEEQGSEENKRAAEEESFTEVIPATFDDKPLAAGNPMGRALFPQDSSTLQNRQSGIMASIMNRLNPNQVGTASGAASSVPLVGDEAKLTKSFKQQEALEKQEKAASSADSKSTSTTTSTTPSTTTTSTTTTTTPMPPTSTMSQEEVEQEKIFKEFFGSRDGSGGSSNSNLNLLLSAFKSKLGFGKPIPPAVLKQNIQSELASLHATSTPAPVLSLPIAAAPIAPALVIATPLPPLATTDYQGSSVSSSLSHPGYISYDEAKKTIASTYALEKPAGYVEPKKYEPAANYDAIKKPTGGYVDPLKGQVNGPVEVPALAKYPAAAQAKQKVKLDYVEYEKPDYRSNDLRLGSITPFNRIPALTRYSNVVSSVSQGVSKGVSSLYAGVKPQLPSYPFNRT